MTRQQRIVAYLEAHGTATFPELMAHLECKNQTIGFVLLDARKAGLIQRTGTRRRYVYSLPARKSELLTRRLASIFDT